MTGLRLVVLYVSDLQASLSFYRSCGLALVPERHGSGPRHYSADLGGVVLELYPRGSRPPTRTRLELEVDSVGGVSAALAAAGFIDDTVLAITDRAPDAINGEPYVPNAVPKCRLVLSDPDGNSVGLSEPTS